MLLHPNEVSKKQQQSYSWSCKSCSWNNPLPYGPRQETLRKSISWECHFHMWWYHTVQSHCRVSADTMCREQWTDDGWQYGKSKIKTYNIKPGHDWPRESRRLDPSYDQSYPVVKVSRNALERRSGAAEFVVLAFWGPLNKQECMFQGLHVLHVSCTTGRSVSCSYIAVFTLFAVYATVCGLWLLPCRLRSSLYWR